VGKVDAAALVLAEAGEALRRQRTLNDLRAVAPVDAVDGSREIAIAHERDDEVRVHGALAHGDVEMLDACADVGDDPRDFAGTPRTATAVHENPDRAVELADAVRRAREVQLGPERGLEKALGDLGVGEDSAL